MKSRGIFVGLSAVVMAAFGGLSAAASPPPPTGEEVEPVDARELVELSEAQLAAVPALAALAPAAQAAVVADASARLTRDGSVVFFEPESMLPPQQAPVKAAVEGTSALPPAPSPLDQTFLLHSRPTSTHKIYLDFDGATATGWTASPVGLSPFDLDGAPATFGDDERQRIQLIWAEVSEDFAPFDVDITTEPVSDDALVRASQADQAYGVRIVVTANDPIGCGCVGVAQLAVFDDVGLKPVEPSAYLETSRLNGSPNDIAVVVSHELGHTLGLLHDGDSVSPYYYGRGWSSWAPLMGTAYLRRLSTWSNGDYLDATNQENDVAVIAATGAPLIADDAGDTNAAAPTLAIGDQVTGVIADRTDVDRFAVRVTRAGRLTTTAMPAPYAPNLDIALSMLAADGTVLATSNPPSQSLMAAGKNELVQGLSAGASALVTPGTYYIRVDGAGSGDPLGDGYSDYGILGRYSLVARLTGTTDTTSPNTTITSPASNARVPDPELMLAGVATDSGGVAEVRVSLRRVEDPYRGNIWYTGDWWTNSDTSSSTPVTFSAPLDRPGATSTPWKVIAAFGPPGAFELIITVTDVAGNTRTLAARAFSSDTSLPPAPATTNPAAGAVVAPDARGLVKIQGTATDDVLVRRVELTIRHSDGRYWNGGGWQTVATTVTGYPSGRTTATWLYNMRVPAGETAAVTVRARTYDSGLAPGAWSPIRRFSYQPA